ncbi:MAG: hypothetical protein ACRENE_31470 [Polyangiaceae bacterium]
MSPSSFSRKRVALILPAVLLLVNLVEDVVTYKVRQHVRDAHVRTAFALVLYGAAFVIAADWVSPWLERTLTKTRRDSARHAGTMGLMLFYAVAYGGLYCAYLLCDLHGPASLLPRAWR